MSKYIKWYNNLIESRKTRILPADIYTEKHHIIPRSLGGNDSDNNLIRLLPREHFIAHLLLAKIYTGQNGMKMVHALRRMLTGHTNARYIPNSRVYQIIRTLSMEKCSGKNNPMYGRTGENHPSFGRKESIYNDEFKAKVSAKGKGRIAWNKGLSGAVKMSSDTKKKMSDSAKGKIKSDEWKAKIGEATKNSPIITCPHCGKSGKQAPMARWHFDNCHSVASPEKSIGPSVPEVVK